MSRAHAWLSASEVARATGLSRKTVDAARAQGRLVAHRTGTRHWYYTAEGVATWVRSYSPKRRAGDSNPMGVKSPGDSGHQGDE